MLFSVLMCCNRDDGYLDIAIKSVLDQTVKDFEFIIILNNCTDDLYEKVKTINDTRIRLYRNYIGQLAFNLNFGIEVSNGTYIVRFDADDICDKDRLKITKSIIENNSTVDIIAGSSDLIDENGVYIADCILNPKTKWKKVIKYRNPFIHPATTIKRSFLIQMKGYSGGFQSEDYDLWLRAAKLPDVNVEISPIKFIRYRISTTQARGNRLGYAEVSGLMIREFIMKPTLINIVSSFVSIAKSFIKGKNNVQL